ETRELRARNIGANVSRSICPYCGVGCGQLIFHKDNELINIEGDPDSPISRGRLCPKGSDTHQLHTHSARLLTVKYRAPMERSGKTSISRPRWTWSPTASGTRASGRLSKSKMISG